MCRRARHEVAPEQNTDVALQRIVRLMAGETVTPLPLAPHDVAYLVGADRYYPCRLVRVVRPAPGALRLTLTWREPCALLNVWLAGRMYHGTHPDLSLDLPAGIGETVLSVGMVPISGAQWDEYVPFTLATAMDWRTPEKEEDMRKMNWSVAASRLTWVVLAVALAPLSSLLSAQDPPEFSDWSAPVPLGPPVNTPLAEIAPAVSKDGLSLYYVRTASAGGLGGMDIWVSQRTSIDDAWGPPQNLGSAINTSFNDFGPSLTLDGHTLFFASNRPGFGANDLYVSRRPNKRDDFGWRPAVNLGSAINTAASEIAAAYFEDDLTGVITFYFASNRPDGLGGDDIYASTLLPDETFGVPVLVEELSTSSSDLQPAITRDGLQMFISSSRPGTLGSLDLWVSTRSRTTDPWSPPMNLGALVNSVGADARASLSFDATELYFQSNRDGSQDFYRSTRMKLK